MALPCQRLQELPQVPKKPYVRSGMQDGASPPPPPCILGCFLWRSFSLFDDTFWMRVLKVCCGLILRVCMECTALQTHSRVMTYGVVELKINWTGVNCRMYFLNLCIMNFIAM